MRSKQQAATDLNARRRHGRADRERALVRAAIKLFASHGYEATTTREIAAYAGCSEGLIHRYCKSKEGLLRAVMSSHTSQRMLELAEHLPDSDSLEEEMRQLMYWEVNRMWQDRNFLRVALQRAMLDPKIARSVRHLGPARLAKVIADRLRVLGPDHPNTLTTRFQLARWRGEAGNPAGAVTALEQLLPDDNCAWTSPS